jgi:hypothetical protein
MVKPYRRFHVPQLQPDRGAPDGANGWTILWDTRMVSIEEHWSVAHAKSESEALERAAHFLRLGFAVHAIKDPSGSTFLDEDLIRQRFAPTARRDSSGTTPSEGGVP